MVERTCGSCGADPGAGSFCQHCGARLDDETPGVADPPTPDIPPAATPPTPPPAAPVAAPPPTAVPEITAKRSGCRSGCLIGGVVVLAVILVGGFFAWSFVTNEILPGVQETVDEVVAATETPPGPCYDLEIDDGFITGFNEVSCDGARQVEVIYAAPFDEGPFPGDQYLEETAADICPGAFETYVGVPPDQSAHAVDWILPTEQTWADGTRQGICLVVAGDGSVLTGTVKGSSA